MTKTFEKIENKNMTQLNPTSNSTFSQNTKLKGKKVKINPESSQAEEMVLLIKRQRQQQGSFSYIKLGIIILICLVLGTVFYFVFLKTGIFKKACLYFYDVLMKLYEEHPYMTFFVIWIIEVLSLMLLLPFYSILTFIVCSIFKNFLLSYLYCLFCSVCGSTIIYFLCSTKFKPYLIKRFNKNVLFGVLREYSKQKPWKTAFLTRFLFIAAGVKEYILALIDNPYWPFIGSACCLHTMWILEVCFIHMEIGEISSFMDRGSTPWAKRSLTEKIYTIFGFVIIGFTVIFMCYLGVKAKTIVQKQKEKEEIERKITRTKTLEKIV
jgi:hypothetical protein